MYLLLLITISLLLTLQTQGSVDKTFALSSFSRAAIEKRVKSTYPLGKCISIRGGSSVPYFATKPSLDSALSDPQNAGKLFVIDFTATWCGPCKMIAPFFEEMSVEFGDACFFAKVDVDEGAEIAQAYSVMSMPTFLFIKDGKIVDRFSGASVEKLRQTVFAHINE